MTELGIDYEYTGNIPITTRRKIPVKQFGIKKVVVVRTRQNGGIPKKK